MIVNAGRCILLALDRGSFVHQCIGKNSVCRLSLAADTRVLPTSSYPCLWSGSGRSANIVIKPRAIETTNHKKKTIWTTGVTSALVTGQVLHQARPGNDAKLTEV